ncbi:MAG: TetR/AcrR family transcriptional regulator [Bacteroidota bacterium]
MNTKAKIIQQATEAFTTKGFGAVSLYELAQAMGISRGNLTYHFKDKDALLEAISSQMWEKISTERNKSRQLPSFENLHNEIQLYYKFQKEYAFIFLDRHVLKHPVVKQQFREMTAQTLADNKAAIAFAIQLGNLKSETYPGLYHNIAFTTWMLTFFWLPQQIIRGEKQPAEGEKLVWSLLIPHMTEKGLASFEKFFGKEYLHTLGEAFPTDIQSFITF